MTEELKAFEAWWEKLPGESSVQERDDDYEADAKGWAWIAWRARAEKVTAQSKPIYQFRVSGCSDWYDGHPDLTDGKAYETRIVTAVTQPVHPAQSPDGRTIDKAMVKRLAIQHGLLTDWRPIETAPKDGAEVLLYLGNPWSKTEKARWYAPWSNWQVGAIPSDPVREEYFGIGKSVPTHWMPLPEAPNGAKP